MGQPRVYCALKHCLRRNANVKLLGMMLLLVGMGSAAFASGPASVPEIGPLSASGAIALIASAVLVMRGRRKK